ncbi:hypothetical protein AnigIFM63604_011205 [Aspergillus niger]|uniref:Uncharacterized protein n=1 Tax=Aspergillus niger TaxID=5061 RepID=A0A9W6AA15_ASPNG|nr:hypothetical protein AnigIFM63604_011205 [Aspergillus niger]
MFRSLVALGLTIGLLAKPGAAVTVDEAFDISTSTGSYASRLSKLTNLWEDTNTLVAGLATAYETAVGTEATEDRVVAQKLFTAWMGVQFDNSGDAPAPIGKFSGSYMAAFEENFDVLEQFVLSGEYPSWKTPAKLFCDNFGDWFDWTDQALDASGKPVELNGVALTIEDMFEQVREQDGYDAHRPYWVSDQGVYVFPRPTSTGDLCGQSSGGKTLQGVSIPGYWQGYYQATVNGETETIEYDDLADIVLLCPDSFDSEVPWQYETLADLSTLSIGEEISLYDVMPRSSTLFHELWHLITFWMGKKIEEPMTGRLTDHKYLVQDCIVLATGWYSNMHPVQNVENYVYLAVTWWFWVEKKVAFYDGKPRAWDWDSEEEDY